METPSRARTLEIRADLGHDLERRVEFVRGQELGQVRGRHGRVSGIPQCTQCDIRRVFARGSRSGGSRHESRRPRTGSTKLIRAGHLHDFGLRLRLLTSDGLVVREKLGLVRGQVVVILCENVLRFFKHLEAERRARIDSASLKLRIHSSPGGVSAPKLREK